MKTSVHLLSCLPCPVSCPLWGEKSKRCLPFSSTTTLTILPVTVPFLFHFLYFLSIFQPQTSHLFAFGKGLTWNTFPETLTDKGPTLCHIEIDTFVFYHHVVCVISEMYVCPHWLPIVFFFYEDVRPSCPGHAYSPYKCLYWSYIHFDLVFPAI